MAGSKTISVAVALALCACFGRQSVTGHVLYPAAVPVHRFETIVLVRGHLNEEVWLARELAEELGGGHTVRVVPSGDDSSASDSAELRVELDLTLRESMQTRWTSVPETACGAFGCYSRMGSRLAQMPHVDGELALRFSTGRPEEAPPEPIRLATELSGSDHLSLRREIVRQLARRAAVLLIERRIPTRVVMLEVEALPDVQRALAHLRENDWSAAREILERALHQGEVRQLSRNDQARVYYNLGMMRRFDLRRDQSIDAQMNDAAELLRRAVAIDPHPRYEAAIEELDLYLSRLRAIRAQRAAVDREIRSNAVPEAPQAYRDAQSEIAADPSLSSGGETMPPVPPPPNASAPAVDAGVP